MEIVQTKTKRPLRMVVFGRHGLGKSSLGAAAPDPIFINVEDGLSEIDTSALPLVETFQNFMEQLRWIYTEDHGKKTLVIDSLDRLEGLIFKSVAIAAGADSISDIGYGAGYGSALAEFERVIAALTSISRDKGMHIICLAHAEIREYKNPIGEDYATFRIKLREKNAELFAEFASMVGFLRFEAKTKTKKEGFAESTKVLPNAARVLCVHPDPAFDAKNRFGITRAIQISSPEEGMKSLLTLVYPEPVNVDQKKTKGETK